MLKKLIFIFVFILLNSISFYYLGKAYLHHKNEIITAQVAEFENLYESAVTTFRLNSKVVFNNIVMQPEVLSILRKVPHSEKEQLSDLHTELHKLLEKKIRQLTRNNVSKTTSLSPY